MQKIMFNNTYGLTEAVLEGRKTMTRRLLPQDKINGRWDYNSYYDYCLKCKRLGKNEITWDEWLILHHGKYKVGEVVAVAEPYETVLEEMITSKGGYGEEENEFCEIYKDTRGWNNKMFVRADLMPHKIQITDIKLERLQDISDEDCMKEGIRLYTTGIPQCKTQVVGSLEFIPPYGFDDYKHKQFCNFDTPREAFAALTDKINGKGTWKKNPHVVAYSFAYVIFN